MLSTMTIKFGRVPCRSFASVDPGYPDNRRFRTGASPVVHFGGSGVSGRFQFQNSRPLSFAHFLVDEPPRFLCRDPYVNVFTVGGEWECMSTLLSIL